MPQRRAAEGACHRHRQTARDQSIQNQRGCRKMKAPTRQSKTAACANIQKKHVLRSIRNLCELVGASPCTHKSRGSLAPASPAGFRTPLGAMGSPTPVLTASRKRERRHSSNPKKNGCPDSTVLKGKYPGDQGREFIFTVVFAVFLQNGYYFFSRNGAKKNIYLSTSRIDT